MRRPQANNARMGRRGGSLAPLSAPQTCRGALFIFAENRGCSAAIRGYTIVLRDRGDHEIAAENENDERQEAP